MSTKLLVELPPAMAERLEKVAHSRGATKGGLMRLALETFMRQLAEEENQQFVVSLSDPAAETLAAYREVNDFPVRDRLVERALMHYIQGRCMEDPVLQNRLEEARSARARTRIRAITDRKGEGRA